MGIFDAKEFDETETAPTFQYIQPNSGTTYKVLGHKELVKADAFVAELEVVESSDGVHPVGSVVSYMISFGNKKVRDASLKEAKRYFAALMGKEPNEVTAAEFSKSCDVQDMEGPKGNQKPIITSKARDDGHIGRLIRGTAEQNAAGTYTKKFWFSARQA